MSKTKPNLNKAQLEAVSHGDGPLLIVAGAGTGKTTVITQRIAHLILDKGLEVDQVLALTFTEKAAAEMEERLDQVLPYGYVDLWVSTFHSFCERILRQYGLDFGIPTDFKILTQTEQWLLVRQNLHEFELEYYKPKGNPTKFIHALLSHFSRAKDEEIYPEDYMQYADKHADVADSNHDEEVLQEAKRIAEVARAYDSYQRLLLDNNYLDFGDLINYTIKLLRERPKILRQIQEQFKYVLVDEFQDTNYAQYELIKMIAGKEANLTVVGDDDQSIYKFRGASISNIMQFKSDFPKAKEVVLTDNYRSVQKILDAAYDFIQLNNPNRLEVALKGIDKKLTSHAKIKGEVRHLHFESLQDEVAGIINTMAELKTKKKLAWSDFAILVRANDSATHFINYLKKTEIPYQFVALRGLYNKPIILDVLAYFKLLDNYHEGPAMYRVLTSDFVDLDYKDLVDIINYSKRKTISIYQTLRRISEVGVSSESVSKIHQLLKLIERHTEIATSRTVGELFVSFLQQSGIMERLLKEETLEDRQNMEYLQGFFKRIREYEDSVHDSNLKDFMEEIDLEMESGDTGSLSKELDLGPDSLQIMTVHSSKGLEFEYVFIPNMVDKRFPTIERKDPIEIPQELIKDTIPEGDVHIQEERRLMYVAMTRAKSGLYLTSAEDYGGARAKKPSRFLVELAEAHKGFKLSTTKKVDDGLVDGSVEVSEGEQLFRPELPKRFSFSQLAAFKKCPYQYKLGFIYKIPVFGKPVFSYGRTMHTTLEEFFTLLAEKMTKGQVDLFSELKNESGKDRIGDLIEEKDILTLLEKSWIDDWYESQKQKDDYRAQAVESLKGFYEKIKEQKPRVKYLEKSFSLKLTSNGDTFTLRGVIDRVDELDNGKWHLIDYKTGSPKEKLEWEDKMQLLIYQIAARELFHAEVEKLTYYYLDDNSEVSFIGEEKDIAKLKKELIDIIESIKDSDFAATPGWQCKFCDYRTICEYKI